MTKLVTAILALHLVPSQSFVHIVHFHL